MCNIEQQPGDHVVIKCRVAMETQYWILKWCGLPNTPFDNVMEIINFAAIWGNFPRKRERIFVVFYGLLWFIWLARNNKVFNAIHTYPAMISNEVISQKFSWFQFRTLGVNRRLIDWSISPFFVKNSSIC